MEIRGLGKLASVRWPVWRSVHVLQGGSQPLAIGTQPTGGQMGMQNLYYISGLFKDTCPNLSK